MQKNIFECCVSLVVIFYEMLVSFFANAPDGDISFGKLCCVFVFDRLLGQFNQVGVKSSGQSTVAGDYDQQYSFNRAFNSQAHSLSPIAVADDVAQQGL